MSVLGAIIQQPVDRLDYDFSCEQWFSEDDDIIQSVDVNILPSGGSLSVNSFIADKEVKLWIEGGSPGEDYTVEFTITSVTGRKKQDEVRVLIRDFI